MKAFMDEDFLLKTDTAKHLYHDFAKDMPIIDYHCHLNPKEIYEDQTYENITQVWLYGDHYKWRQMRSNGIEERYITGDASDYEKFVAYAKTLTKAIGNPLYHWSHLELQRYFDYHGVLNDETAEHVWHVCNEKLKTMSARSIIEASNVKVICTTDDPIDSLEWHKLLKEDKDFSVKVLPTWRPDAILHIQKDGYQAYVAKLSKLTGIEVNSFETLLRALDVRMDFFEEMGCRVSDHGLEYIYFTPYTDKEVNDIFVKKLQGETLSALEINQFKTAFMVEMGKRYAKKDWVMQLHYGVLRDNNKRIFNNLGADAGIDCINDQTTALSMTQYFNALEVQHALPKTIVYSLNPGDNAMIGTVIGCFQDSSCIGKIQHGSAWWFNDHKEGMKAQMTSLASLGLLGNFVGMLTDSRSFLSYTRHEYFRRILCDLLGGWIENGEYPNDDAMLEGIVKGICYDNAKRYFGF